MKIEEIITALKKSIKTELGFPAFLLPQKAVNNTAHIDLQYQDFKPNGDGNAKLVFTAEYVTNGTHLKWLEKTITLQKKLHSVEGTFMLLEVVSEESDGEADTETKDVLRAYWDRINSPRWVYPNEDESSMPAEYVLQYRVEIDIPTNLLED